MNKWLLLLLLARKNAQKKLAKKKILRFYINNLAGHSYKQRQQMLLSALRSSLFGLNFRKPRSIWANERQEFWFHRMLRGFEDENFDLHWKQDFRITQPTFMKIVELVRPRLERRYAAEKGYSNRKTRSYRNLETFNRKFVPVCC